MSVLTCGKCGSSRVTPWVMGHQVPERKCEVCGNLEEKGMPMRYPFVLKEETPAAGVASLQDAPLPASLPIVDTGGSMGKSVHAKCSNNDGKIAVKDGLCTKCFKKKHGVVPFPKKKVQATE